MTLTVMCDPCTVNSRKVLAGLKAMGTQHDFKKIDYFKGEQKSPEFVKINPSATVPAATDGDLVITESNAILQYAADSTPGAEKYYPKDLKQRAQVNRWLLWEASAWFPSCYVYLVENVVKPLLGATADQSILDGESERFNKLATCLETQLSKTKFLAGDNVTIADFAVAAPMHAGPKEGLPLDKYPKLQAWYAEIDKIPAWQETQPIVNEALGLNKYVTANLNYTKDLSDRLTEIYFYEDEKAKGIHEPGDDRHRVQIHDGWSQAKSFSEDKHGFSLHEFHSSYPKDKWEDEALVKENFYPEVVDLLKDKLGAKRVLVFDHTIRTKGNQAKKLTQETNTTQRAPVSLVHCDYTAESGPVRVRQLLTDEADDLLSRRVAFVNVWKPLAKVEEMPLAMCDVQSAPSDDFFKLYLRYRDRTGENYVMRHNPEHKWYYFPEMNENQCIFLKTYDSDKSRAQFVGHSAFEDPTSKPDAPYRESCEIRTICFF